MELTKSDVRSLGEQPRAETSIQSTLINLLNRSISQSHK
jgi:hypothetical protein